MKFDKKKVFRILVIEDSEFFNKLLTRQLQHFADTLALQKGCQFEIRSFTSASDGLRNLDKKTDLAFVDYYLGNGMTADKVLEKIKEQCRECQVVIISQVRNLKTSILTLTKGALDFIFKDLHALPTACFILEDMVNKKLAYRGN